MKQIERGRELDICEKVNGERKRGARGSVISISGRDDPEGGNRAQEGPGLAVPILWLPGCL